MKAETHGGSRKIEDRQRETAQYISDMILELRKLAKFFKLYHVMAPLEFAYYESFSVANRTHPPAEELDRLRQLSRESVKLETAPAPDELEGLEAGFKSFR